MQTPTLSSSFISFGLGLLMMPTHQDLYQSGRKILARTLTSHAREEFNHYQKLVDHAGAITYLTSLLFLLFIEKKVISQFNAGLFAIIPIIKETKALISDPEKKDLGRTMIAFLLISNVLFLTQMVAGLLKE